MPLDEVMQVLNKDAGKHFDPHLIKVFSASASDIYKTLTSSTEAEVKHRLEVMVHKHFGL